MLKVKDMAMGELQALLLRVGFGHLGCTRDNHPYVVPMHYAYDGQDIYFFTTEATASSIECDILSLPSLFAIDTKVRLKEIKPIEALLDVTCVERGEEVTEYSAQFLVVMLKQRIHPYQSIPTDERRTGVKSLPLDPQSERGQPERHFDEIERDVCLMPPAQ